MYDKNPPENGGFVSNLRYTIVYLFCVGAEDEIRTRDVHLGKVALYQMSYSRIFSF